MTEPTPYQMHSHLGSGTRDWGSDPERELLRLFQDFAVDVAVWFIHITNPSKSESLSHRLHWLADWYARRPTKKWDRQ